MTNGLALVFSRDFLIMENNTEILKDIENYEGYYQISNLGLVKKLERHNKMPKGGVRVDKSIILKNFNNGRGYLITSLSKDNKRKSYKIHRLVAMAFIPNPENNPQVNHINGIKTDNRVENLEWCTNSENQIHAFSNNLQTERKGILHNLCKLTEEQVIEIRNIKTNESRSKIAKIYNVSTSTISAIILKRNWKHI